MSHLASPIFDGTRTIPSPQVTNIILDLLKLGPDDKILEIGTGSGYQTNRFALTGAQVHSIELRPWIDTTLETGDCIFLYSGDGEKGLPEVAPFTAIVATCGLGEIPQSWRNQLSEGGRLVAPIGNPECQKLTLFIKRGDDLLPERVAAYTRFQMLRKPPLPGKVRYENKGVA